MPAVVSDSDRGDRVDAGDRVGADRVVVGQGDAVAWAERRGVPGREARWILEHVGSGADGAPDPVAGDGAFRALVERRAAGEPLQYVLGRWPFRSVELAVDRRVLIPRPETEQVVEVALAELDRTAGGGAGAGGRAGAGGPVCVDLGTGSGAIALSLAVEGGPAHPGLEVWATDRSEEALVVAADNLAALSGRIARAGARVHLRAGRWFGALPPDLAGRVDVVVSNPPYVAEEELPTLDAVVRQWEPASALVAPAGTGGVGGLADLEAIVAGASRWLRPGGALVVEHAPHQADAVLAAARRAGLVAARTERDLAGRRRMLVAEQA